MRINNNVMAFNANRNLQNSNGRLGKSLEKLSSGFRINRAGDDAAGLVISQKLRAEVSGLKQATRNSQDGISFVQTAEGALGEVHTMLNRMRDLAVQAANDTNDASARTAISSEMDALVSEIDRIGTDTTFGGASIFTDTALNFQVGSEGSGGNAIAVTVGALSDSDVGGTDLSGLAVTDHTTSRAAIESIDAAIAGISTARGGLGATQNRLESTVRNLQVTSENLAASESRIRDTDMAAEMVNFTKSQILQQAGTGNAWSSQLHPTVGPATAGLSTASGSRDRIAKAIQMVRPIVLAQNLILLSGAFGPRLVGFGCHSSRFSSGECSYRAD